MILVHASFIAAVRTIDSEKKATLARALTARVVATEPGEKLDDKLSALTFQDQQIRTAERE